MFRLRIHVMWYTKNRKSVLRGQVGYRFGNLPKLICSDIGVGILSEVVAKDHVHLLVSIPPQVFVCKLVQKLKGKCYFKLQRGYSTLRKQYWGQRM